MNSSLELDSRKRRRSRSEEKITEKAIKGKE